VIKWFLLAVLIIMLANIAVWIWIYRWNKEVVDDFIHEKAYQYQKMLEDLENEKRYMRANMDALAHMYRDNLERQEIIIDRLIGVMWKDFDEQAKNIISLYLKGYNINEIVSKLGVPRETVQFTLMVALGREVGEDA